MSVSVSPVPFRRHRILLVEDDPSMAALMTVLIHDLGVVVHHAQNADEALWWVGRTRYDLVVLDLQLPGRDGLHVLRALRRDPRTAETPVMLCSSLDEPEHDADLYLAKPFEPQVLKGCVRTLLEA